MIQQINRFKFLLIGLSLGGVWLAGCDRLADAQSQRTSPVSTSQVLISDRDVPYVPTPQAVVDAMLQVAKVGKDDVLYDLGSGDGRIVITAAEKFGTRGVGIDIDPERVQEAQANARKAGVTDRAKFIQQDLFQADFSEATVVTLYLLPSVNLKLRPLLFKQLKPGTRVVSNTFDMDDWKPEKTLKVGNNTVYYWVIPEKVPENLR
jgi:precorrin-6B methylase 2